ncbi:MAG TPA: tlde1 domain-containing protein [Pseudolabrys sp.]|nr:tlde1 domain-containing protein [Pseudolabrys sp.]
MTLRAILCATAAAAAIAGALTWAQDAYLSNGGAPSTAAPVIAQQQTAPALRGSSTIADRHDAVTAPVEPGSDPRLHVDPTSAWRPAGGLATLLMAPSDSPNEQMAGLPGPAPIVAVRNAPPATVTAEVDDVPMPRPHPVVVAAIPLRANGFPATEAPQTATPAAVANAPEAAPDSKPASGGFFSALSRLFTPRDKQQAAAVLATNPHTAIYDISARAVYMPNGETLEAHSGLGEWLDDPASFRRKGRGVTPPNTYKITMREKPFHGVQALRLTPVDGTKMFGRDGMLAHTFMLGPNGQSNGCVSFRDYDKFLEAYNKGEVDRLIVVPRITSATAYAQAN